MQDRLDALAELCATVEKRRRLGTNLHIHTNESFGFFRSPTEAVWQAVLEGVSVFGLNDHYTVAGHKEFRRACKIAKIPAVFSMEAAAMDRTAEANGLLINDPDNPGRVYLCGKGVTRIPPESSRAMQNLSMMRAAVERRNRAMTDKARALFRERMDADGPAWDDVLQLTERGNSTERHVSKAIVVSLRKLAEVRGPFPAEAVAQLCGAQPPADDDAALQNFVRFKLLKAGGTCFVEQSPDAFISMEELRDMLLAFGAIPTYPILADPITESERDIKALADRLAAMKIFAAELFPGRGSRERVAEVIGVAKDRWWPVFNGTEHNTPERKPLLDPRSLDPEFAGWFEQSAAVVLGHQREVEQGRPGFLNDDGTPSLADARARFEHFSAVGAEAIQESY